MNGLRRIGRGFGWNNGSATTTTELKQRKNAITKMKRTDISSDPPFPLLFIDEDDTMARV
jgi:hypothetical protein